MEIQGLRDRAPEFEEAGAEIVGISFDTVDDNAAFAQKWKAPFRLLSDTTKVVGEAFGIVRGPDERGARTPRRTTFLIDPEGLIRKVYVVKDIESHPGDVLDDIRRLQR